MCIRNSHSNFGTLTLLVLFFIVSPQLFATGYKWCNGTDGSSAGCSVNNAVPVGCAAEATPLYPAANNFIANGDGISWKGATGGGWVLHDPTLGDISCTKVLMVTGKSPGCPSGFASVGAFCVEKAEHRGGETVDWGHAAANCAADGFELCSSARWTAACTNLAATAMTGKFTSRDGSPSVNGEWVDDRINIVTGGDGAVGMGATGSAGVCDQGIMNFKTSTLQYRCCSVR